MSLRILAAAAIVVLVSGPAARAADGAKVFKEQCVRCHGATGAADTPMGKAVRAAALAGNTKVQQMTDAQVVERIKTNEKHPRMVRSLGDENLNAVAPFVKQLAAAH